MAKVTCSISGIEMSISHVSMTLPYTAGYTHPIFHLPHKHVYTLYKKHCTGQLNQTESYLTLLALLNLTRQVKWRVPCTLNPTAASTVKIVESNMRQIAEVLELTNTITIPSFKQPSYIISLDTCQLGSLPAWIRAWRDNIERFKSGRQSLRQQEKLQHVENKLSYMIKSGVHKREYSHVVASWAAKAADFPKQHTEEWTKIIRSCFSTEKMFATKLETIKEIKAYCEENIEVGSIHYHALMENIKEGISRHNDFLGMPTGGLGYTLLNLDTTKNELEVETIVAKAPVDKPIRTNYTSELDFLKAKLAYAVSSNAAKRRPPENPGLKTPEGDI